MHPDTETKLDQDDSAPATTLADERRDSVREPFGGPVWWREVHEEQFRQGWLVERSSVGAAFLVKGLTTPLEGTRIRLSTSDPSMEHRPEDGLVKRVKHVHADLFLVAVQLKPI